MQVSESWTALFHETDIAAASFCLLCLRLFQPASGVMGRAYAALPLCKSVRCRLRLTRLVQRHAICCRAYRPSSSPSFVFSLKCYMQISSIPTSPFHALHFTATPHCFSSMSFSGALREDLHYYILCHKANWQIDDRCLTRNDLILIICCKPPHTHCVTASVATKLSQEAAGQASLWYVYSKLGCIGPMQE